jgi:hypothetical protein
MKAAIVAAASLTFAVQLAHAAPTNNPEDLAGDWTLDERTSDDPVRVLRDGDHGRSRNGRVSATGSVFGIPIGGGVIAPRAEDDDDDEDSSLAGLDGVEHVFEATYRLRIRREGNVTEIRYGNEPTITYRDGAKTQRDGHTVQAQWERGTFTVEHELDNGSLVSERYWVDSRSGELHWAVELTRRKGSAKIDRDFRRWVAAEP